MRKAIVDAQGHLRLAYWRQNDLVKGKEIQVDTADELRFFFRRVKPRRIRS